MNRSTYKHKTLPILFLLYTIVINFSFAQQTKEFTHVTQGEFKKFVSSIKQDKDGFIWFSTNNGLNRFDGTNFKVFKNIHNDISSLPHNYVENLLVDSKNQLWISTIGGVCIYQEETETFKRIKAIDKNDLKDDLVNIIFEDNKKRIWWAGSNGLYLLNDNYTDLEFKFGLDQTWRGILQDHKGRIWALGSERIVIIDSETLKVKDIQLPEGYYPFNFRDFVQEQNHDIWVGSWDHGLFKIKESNNSFTLQKLNDDRFPQSKIESLLIDSANDLWVGSENFGLYYYDISEDNVNKYIHDKYNSASINSNVIWSLFEDNQQRIWVGFYKDGIDIIDKNSKKFYSIQRETLSENALSGNAILTFLEDDKNGVWIGTDGFGLNYWDKNSNKFEHYLMTGTSKNIQKGYSILSTTKGSDDNLWIGTWGNGMVKFNPKTKKYKEYTISEKPNTIASNMVFDVEENPKHKGEYWLTVWRHGISRFDSKTGKFYTYSTNPKDSYKGSTVAGKLNYDLLFDNDGNMWLAGDKGLEKIRIKEDYSLFVKHYHNNDDEQVLSDNMASSLYLDSKGYVWICTNNGLNIYNSKTDSFRQFGTEQGLNNTLIHTVIEDDSGNYWVSTEGGISKLIFLDSPLDSEVIVQNYTHTHGLQSGAFNRKSGYKNSKGELYFGGGEGFNLFHPDSIQNLSSTPHVYLNNLKLFNRSILPNDETEILKYPVEQTGEITLNHEQSVFTIEYTGIYFTQPEENQYAFKLDGFEDHWNYVDHQRFATYTSLPAGEYTFMVKAANKDGVWNGTPAQLKIKVLPPWWETTWFKTLFIAVLSGIALLAYKLRVGVLKEQKEKLKNLVKERTREIVNKNLDLEESNERLNTTIEELAVINEQLNDHQEALKDMYEETKVQNENIKSSLNYAKSIQYAMLKSDLHIQSVFRDSFILFKPQNVVSGDFYWFKQITEDIIAVAACDCTGHGVPGALISMLGMNLLNQIVSEGEVQPHIILDKLNVRIKESLNQDTLKGRDGMDAALVIIDKKERTINFAGAKNPLILIKNGELEVFKGDRKSIGGSIEGFKNKIQNFSLKTINYDQKDEVSCYLFSDGYQDQFGGENNKKFMVKNFHRLLEEASLIESFPEQMKLLNKRLVDWQGGERQIDDILVIGLKVN